MPNGNSQPGSIDKLRRKLSEVTVKELGHPSGATDLPFPVRLVNNITEKERELLRDALFLPSYLSHNSKKVDLIVSSDYHPYDFWLDLYREVNSWFIQNKKVDQATKIVQEIGQLKNDGVPTAPLFFFCAFAWRLKVFNEKRWNLRQEGKKEPIKIRRKAKRLRKVIEELLEPTNFEPDIEKNCGISWEEAFIMKVGGWMESQGVAQMLQNFSKEVDNLEKAFLSCRQDRVDSYYKGWPPQKDIGLQIMILNFIGLKSSVLGKNSTHFFRFNT